MHRYALDRLALAWLAAFAAGPAAAHDTWFETWVAAPGEVRLALGTGNRFPTFDSSIGAEFVVRQGCRGGDGRALPLTPLRSTPTALEFRAVAPAPATCWAQLQPFIIDVPADKIDLYMQEIRPSLDARSRWDGIRARGLPWRERYVKHARIDLGATPPADPQAAPDMDVELLLENAERPLRRGQTLRFRLLRQGQPVAGQALELRTELSPLGIWNQTDAEGRVRLTVPLAGRWLLRGTALRPSTTQPDAWDSDFVTLAFSVSADPSAAPKGGN